MSLEDQVIHHEAVDAFSASLQELPLILKKFPANCLKGKKSKKKGATKSECLFFLTNC